MIAVYPLLYQVSANRHIFWFIYQRTVHKYAKSFMFFKNAAVFSLNWHFAKRWQPLKKAISYRSFPGTNRCAVTAIHHVTFILYHLLIKSAMPAFYFIALRMETNAFTSSIESIPFFASLSKSSHAWSSLYADL